MTPIYIAYYTAGTGYADEARELIRTLETFDLPHDVRAIADPGNWMAAVSHKPTFIAEMMAAHRRPLVYVDVDARIRRRPEYFDSLAASDVDLAAVWKDEEELFAATLYVGVSERAAGLIQAWRAACAARPDEVDQRCLQAIVERGIDAKIERLPAAYAAIFDARMCPESEWVISQHQASRRLRR